MPGDAILGHKERRATVCYYSLQYEKTHCRPHEVSIHNFASKNRSRASWPPCKNQQIDPSDIRKTSKNNPNMKFHNPTSLLLESAGTEKCQRHKPPQKCAVPQLLNYFVAAGIHHTPAIACRIAKRVACSSCWLSKARLEVDLAPSLSLLCHYGHPQTSRGRSLYASCS